MKHLFLCGFMGCGKSAVGAMASKIAGVPFVDLDEAIVREAGMAIPEIFEKHDERYFRALETSELAKAAFSSEKAIVATGGGALTLPANVELCKKHGAIIFLDVPFESCYARIHKDPNRPKAAGRSKEELLALYDERKAFYLAACDHVVPNNGIQNRAKAVAEFLK